MILRGFLGLLLFQCIGELIKYYLHLPIPGPVIGMFLLFAYLLLSQDIPPSIKELAPNLIQWLTLMFLPTTVGLFFLGAQFDDQWPAILGACLLGSWVTMVVVALLLKRTIAPRAGH